MTKKEPPPDPFIQALTQIASAQMRAAQARFRPVDPALEKPRDVTAKFVESVAVGLGEAVGPTKFVSSRREVQIRRGDLTFCYPFQASTNNTAGATIALWPYAAVHSHTLRLWRRGKPWARDFGRQHSITRTDDGYFAGGMLGNFFAPPRYIALEIVNATERQAVLRQVIADCLAVDAQLRHNLIGREAFFAYATRPDTEMLCLGDYACEYIAAIWGMEAVKQYASDAVDAIDGGHSLLRQHFAEVSANPDSRARASVGFRVDGIARFFFAHELSFD